jgi:hypothetical protein
MKNAYVLFSIHEGKRPVGRRRYRWHYNIKMNFRCKQDSCGSGHRRAAGSYEHGNEPPGSIKGDEILG